MKKHRKLFPTGKPTNGTECSDFCGDPFATFYYPQPPPPPSLPLPSPLAVAEPDNEQGHGVSASVVVLFTLLASFLLLLLYYVVVSKSCLRLCRRRRRRGRNHDGNREDHEGDFADQENQAVDHHHHHPIWLIATVGLQQSIINSITVVRYKKGEGLIEGTDCSVCLNEFRDGETLRLLPKCSHAFHVACIDTWLLSHTNCPLCRAHIVTSVVDGRQNPSTASRGSSDNSANQNDNQEAREVRRNSGAIIARRNDNDEIEENDVVTSSAVRRSVSMDHMNIRVVRGLRVNVCDQYLARSREGDFGGHEKREERFSRMIRVSPVAMKKRSLSCGGRFFSSGVRTNNQLRLINSVLNPL